MKISELRFAVQVVPWQSEEIQKKVFDRGGRWGDGDKDLQYLDYPFLIIDGGTIYRTIERRSNAMDCRTMEREYGLVTFPEAIRRLDTCDSLVKRMTKAEIEAILGYKIEIDMG